MLIVSVFLLLGCSEDEIIEENCVTSVLTENDMVEYNGQELGCKFFLELYHYKKKQFFVLGSHCADILPHAMDCEGNIFCKDSECKDFFANAKKIGIVGVNK